MVSQKKRWENAIDVMLERKLGVQIIHLILIIGLVEADFNIAMKIMFAKKLMWQAENLGIAPDQCP